ncbi:uncharacterized protein LOC128641740 [Bombina bombina]|uniref:uncharacterized protein LOC128641740 n=1 Tax=Bombina bombina TaxID=8345 RepID=UPI00235B0E59|nr:uncharacterized protein LOC128641740 [Bombina bombina]
MTMELYAVLLSAVLAGVLGKSSETSGEGESCVECPDNVQTTFRKGQRYSYSYSTVTSTFLQGGSSERSQVVLDCTVHIDALEKCHMILKLQDVHMRANVTSKQGSETEFESLSDVLKRYPLQFSYHDGKIQKICPTRLEPTWALNLKRGILSVLQVTRKTSYGTGTVEEVDIAGKCPTTYEYKGASVWKRKILNKCSHRVSSFTNLRSVALPDKTQILDSHLECRQNFKDNILTGASCDESHLVTLFSRDGNGAKTQTQTALKLLKTEGNASSNKAEIMKDIYVTNLLYEKEIHLAMLKGEDVATTVRNLCLAPNMNFETADLFMTLVFELRQLSAEALSDLWLRSSFKCRDNWQPLLDALPSCGTEACVGLMKDILISKELDEDKVDAFLWSLAFIPAPTTGMIASLTTLLQEPTVSQSAYLSTTALIHHFCLGVTNCHEIPEVQAVMRILQEQLGDNCTAPEPEDVHKVLILLKAIGNAGLAASPLIQTLTSCAFHKSNPAAIRIATVEAFRRIPCSANRNALVQLYQAADESEEIRIASYYTAMKCPSRELFHIVRHTLRHERSTQVGSFVWNHLSQLLESDDPLKRDIGDFLPEDILSKEFEGESWKYSTYSDATVHSESTGANVEASLVFTPLSFIPRSAMANLTIHIMGRAVNVLETSIRLENAEDILKKMLGHHSSTLSEFFGLKDVEDKHAGAESPMETVSKVNERKQTSKRFTHGEHTETKSAQQKTKKSNHSCPSGKYTKLDELQHKFTKGMENRKEMKCGISVKIFGNELSFLDCDGIKNTMKQFSLSMAELAVKLLKGQEVQYSKRFSLATEEGTFPVISGIPVQLSLNATASTNIKIRGNMDFKQQSHFFINGYIKPSALIQLSAQMGTVGTLGKIGLRWETGIRAMNSLDGGIQVKRGQELKVFLNTPEEHMEILNFSSKLYLVTLDGLKKMNNPRNQMERRSCLNEEVSKLLGWQPCVDLSYPDTPSLLPLPLSGPAKASITLRKQDKGLRQYLLEASYNHVSQKDGWFPNEASCHFFMGTPKSEFKRDVGIDLHFNILQRKFKMKIVHPKKKIQLDGKLESSRHSKSGYLELILDDKEAYYIKGMTELQTVSGEQRYTAQAEIKPTRFGSPIILSGNITKQLGKKITFAIALNNLLKETAFLSAHIDKKADDKLTQYSVDGEVFLPGLLGAYAIGLLQQRGNLWSNAVRIKYGLLADAKHLRHECDTAQKIKMETNSDEDYSVDIEHEFHCTQVQSVNHKVHLHHEEDSPHIHSLLEVSYGKHWDEINNKKKLFISQTLKNNSNPLKSSYFMEFAMQVAEKQVNYRTQLLHTYSALESNTNFKVQYNDRVPFVAGLQWKDASKNGLRKWEGAFTTDTPWLYLYSGLKLNQLKHNSYQTTLDLTTGKALTIKNLLLDAFYKDNGSEKEGRIHIHTPTVTYLRVSTVHVVGISTFRSYSEMVSLWTHLFKNEIHLENNEKAKSFCFKIKCARREFNLTADYRCMESPLKSNFSVKTVWADQKGPPLVLQLDGHIEELKKEKMLYQKQGLIHFRHPFKLPVPQNILIQETFTVDKTKRNYILETRLRLDRTDECVQTLVFGYQTDNPYVCASLLHPYKMHIIPNNIEVCAQTKRQVTGKQEVEASIKVNKKDVFGLTGKLQTKSSKKELWHILRMDMTHSFQVRFPRVLVFDGEVFSRQSKHDDFDHGANGRIVINKNDMLQLLFRINGSLNHVGFYSQLTHPYQLKIPQDLQVHASAKQYGAKNVNGTLSLHSNGKDLVLVEIDLSNDKKKNVGMIGLSASLHQVVLSEPEFARLRIIGKALPSRLSLFSEMKINEKSLKIDLLGSKEQKVGFVLSFTGNVQHNIDDLTVIPNQLSVDGALKQKKNLNEGYIFFVKNQEMYQIHLRNRNVLGNNSLHNISLTLAQNGSRAFPTETKLRAHVQVEESHSSGEVCIQVDDKLLCMDLLNAGDLEHRGIRGRLTHNIVSLRNAGIPVESAVEVTLNNKSINRTCILSLDTGNSRIDISVGLERSSTQSQLMTSLRHNVSDLKYHGLPYNIDGICYYQSSSKRFATGVTVYVENEQIKAEINKRTIGSSSDIILHLHNDLSSINNIVPSSIKVICNGEVNSNIFYSHCHGEIARTTLEVSVPVKSSFNGSLLTNGDKTNVFGLVTSGDTFARININAETGLQNSIEIGFRHSLPQLYSLGVAKDNKIKFSATIQGRNTAQLDVAIGKCILKANGATKVENNGTSASFNWTTSVINSCSTLENLNIPKSLVMNGSVLGNPCNFGLSLRLEHDGKDAKLHLVTSCEPFSLLGSLNHSIQHLSKLGLPSANLIVLSAAAAPSAGVTMSVQSGQCRILAKAESNSNNITKWMLLTETDCKLLKDLNIPAQSAVNGSLVINGCKSEFLCMVMSNGNASELQIRTECNPKAQVEVVFRHNLFLLQEVNEESRLLVRVGKQSNYDFDILLNSGNCTFEGKGEIYTENKLQWKMLLENKCKSVQDLGAPRKINGSGHIAINKKTNLDSQMLIMVDERAVQGSLSLKAAEKKQQLGGILMHNIRPAVAFGIPEKTAVDITTERDSELYKRSVQLSLDNKKIAEEMSFIQKIDHISINYKINHNLDTLKKLLSEDTMELKAFVDLKETRNVSVVAWYGPHLVNASLQLKINDTETNVTGLLHHNWPKLRNSGIPVSTQASLNIQRTDVKHEISIQMSAEQMFIGGTAASLCTAKECRILFQSSHNSEAFIRSGYPKISSLAGRLRREGDTSSAAFDMELDKKQFSADVNISAQQVGRFEIVAGIKHHVPVLRSLGIPSTTQMLMQVALTKADVAGILKLSSDQMRKLFISVNARSGQQSDELKINALHNISVLQLYIPTSCALVTQVSYSANEAGGNVSLVLDEREIYVSAKFNNTGASYLKTLQLRHSIQQLKNLPAQIVIKTVYEKINKTRRLNHITLWGRKELTLVGSYTGQFPKLSGSHEISGEFSQSLNLPILPNAKVRVNTEHSAHTHQDLIVLGWDGKEQVGISSSLRIRKERLDFRASLTHPFKFMLKQMEISSLTESKGSRYSQQTQIAWNKGQPVTFRIILEDKLTNISKVCNACVTVLPGQVQQLLGIGNLQACGFMERALNTFHESVAIRWDDKQIRQSLMYETSRAPHPDSLQINAMFENVFYAVCNKQQITTKIHTNFMDMLDHSLELDFCNLPHPFVLTGKHQLNAEQLLKSETRFIFSPNSSDDTLFLLALHDYGTAHSHNYSFNFKMKASEDVQIGVLGRYLASPDDHHLLLEGRLDENEKWVLDASKGEKCLEMNVAHKLQGDIGVQGVVLSACVDPKHLIALNSYLNVNGTKHEQLGQLLLSAADQSLSLSYQGCGDTIARAETFISNLGSHLKMQLTEMKNKIEKYVKGVQQRVQQYDFLYDGVALPYRILQDVAGLLQLGLKEVNQLWKESSLRHILRHDLPMYFEIINNLVQQMQVELQKPLATLKEAYYDATLKPLDNVWQEKTENFLKKVHGLLPSIVKDEWLMEPVRRLLDAVKAGVDVGSNQLLKWTEAKLARAVGKIRKPLTNLFSSSSNCSVTLILPVEYHPIDLTNITHYVIEEKLMKPLKEMYSVNPMAEFYRFKRKLMESPFEYHALLIGHKHVLTFDGHMVDLNSKCSLLLAKDFSNDTFTVILNQGTSEQRSLHVEMNKVALDIYPGMKIEENCQNVDLPLSKNGITIKKDANKIEVSNQVGVSVQCDIHHDVCSVTLQGWHHGVSAGLFGTNDNEAQNDFLLPDHSHTNSSQDFLLRWQVDSQCNPARKKPKACPTAHHHKLCKALFQGARSVLRNCFKVISPTPFYSLCVDDICESNDIKPICNLAAAYVHLCNRNFVPIEIPSHCG